MRSSSRAVGAVLAVALSVLLAGCGGGFGGSTDAPPDETVRSYVALGDAFTAAPGVGDSDNRCRRSDANYPALLAKELAVKEFRDVSCAGATTSSIAAETKLGEDESPVRQPIDAFDADTDLVSINVGIEERDLLSHVFEVCLAVPCGDKVTPQVLLSDVSAMADSLTSAVREVQDKASNAYIVVIGYPAIAPDAGSCEALPEVDQTGLDAANRVFDEINREARFAARQAGVGFLDVDRLSTGHELCSSEPWVETSKGKKGGRTDYRPVAAEQKAVATALAELVRNH